VAPDVLGQRAPPGPEPARSVVGADPHDDRPDPADEARERHAAGLIDWFDPEGLSIDDMIGEAIGRLKDDPLAVAAGRAGTHAMTDVLRIWTERCAPDARGHLDADVAIRWDNSLDIDAAVDAFATFLCRHRDAGETTEVI